MIREIFYENYVDLRTPISIESYREVSNENGGVAVEAQILDHGQAMTIYGKGNGVIDAFAHALEVALDMKFEIVDYREHSLEYGKKARAISYVQISDNQGHIAFGAGTSSNIIKSSLRAVVSAVNKIAK